MQAVRHNIVNNYTYREPYLRLTEKVQRWQVPPTPPHPTPSAETGKYLREGHCHTNARTVTPEFFRVPTRTGKLGKMERYFPVGEKSGNFEETGKVGENHTKYWKTNVFVICYFNDI